MTHHRVTQLGPQGHEVAIEIDSLVFPGGEVQIRVRDAKIDPTGKLRITALLNDSQAIMELLLLTDALKRTAKGAPIELVCPYFPYARQDRVCAPGEALSARVMAQLINAQGYSEVEVWDPHSDVIGALVDRIRVVPALAFVRRLEVFNGANPPVLVAPDAGALKKVAGIANDLGVDWVRADKSRDPRTGKITGTVVYSNAVGDRDFLIVDDICDGGRTFTELAQVLRPLTAGKNMMYVTHGIFSAGVEPILKEIDSIYTAHALRKQPENPRLHLINQGEQRA
jgi:ribose-phosphate pyrophosphokinase